MFTLCLLIGFGSAIVLAASEFMAVPDVAVLVALLGVVVAAVAAAWFVWRRTKVEEVGLIPALGRSLRGFLQVLWELVM